MRGAFARDILRIRDDPWLYFSDASCVESASGGLFVIEYVSATPQKRP
jgi:hypothetical protein